MMLEHLGTTAAVYPHPAHLQGSAVYAPEKDALVWKIKNFPGGREFLLRCKFGLPSVAAEEEQQGRLPPIKVKFEVRSSCGREAAHALLVWWRRHVWPTPTRCLFLPLFICHRCRLHVASHPADPLL